MTEQSELDTLIDKYTSYVECDEYHYGVIDGRPGNHDPKDGHMEFDEEAFKQALTEYFQSKMLEIIGEDDNATGSGGGVYAVRIKGRNTLRAELRAKVREMK